MRLLRSEEDLDGPGGAVVPLPQLQDLARRWYGDRLDPGWRRRPLEASQAILAAVGLTGPFWSLGPGLGE